LQVRSSPPAPRGSGSPTEFLRTFGGEMDPPTSPGYRRRPWPLAIPLRANEQERSRDHEDDEKGPDDQEVRRRARKHDRRGRPVVRVTDEVDGVPHGREVREDVERKR